MPSLTDLILTDNPALGVSTEKWSHYLLRVKQKDTLDLSNYSVTWEDIDMICVVLDRIPTLTNLNLTSNTALGGSAILWAKNYLRFTKIQTLNLSDCSLQLTDIEHIASVLSGILTLSLAGNTALGGSADLWAENLLRFPNLQTLNLSNCTLRWTDIKHIASALDNMPSLTDLILTDNPALGVSTEKWSRYLLRVKQKHTLDLSNSSLTWEDIDTISVVLDHIPTLTNLNLTGNTALGRSADLSAKNLLRFTNLQTLNLSNCTLQGTDIEHIASALSGIPTLTNLSLASNTALGGLANLWAENLLRFTNIQTLNLSNCTLQWTDIEHIASVISGIPTLTNLSLAGNTALGGSANLWAMNLLRFRNLQTLNLSNCTLQWTDIKRIAWASGAMPRLTNLILTDNPALGVSTEKWSHYLLRVKQKDTLDLSNYSLTWEDIDMICVVLDRIPTLTNLNLTSNTALGESANLWAKNCLRFTKIQTLNLSDCTLQLTDFEHIASVLSGILTLTNLSLAGNTALGGSANVWAKNLLRFTNLQTLNLSNCTLQWTDIEHIALAVGTMPSLTDLILTDNPALGVSTEKWSHYLLRVKQKDTLDLSNSLLTWEDIDTISVVLDRIPTLTNLNLTGNTALGRSANLWAENLLRFMNIQTLNLSNCTLQWRDINHIALAVGAMPSLTDLILTDNPALGVLTEKLSHYLFKVKQRDTLDLSNYSVTWKDIDTISVVLDRIPRLTNLSLAGNTALGGSANLWAENLLRFTNIQTLNLSNCTLQWTDFEHIALAVGTMPSLTDLILADNPALGVSTEEWSRYLLRVKEKHTLDLSNSSLTWKDVGTISTVVSHILTLKYLSLAGNQALGRSAEKWAKELPKMLRLNRLDLSFCDLTPTDIEHIAPAVGNMPKLTALNLASNKAMSESACAKELAKMTHLNRLDLRDCNFQPSDFEHIASAVGEMLRLTDLYIGGNLELLDKLKSRFPSLRVHMDLSRWELPFL
ncbi:uncharacterized protein LOC119726353 [Patiria miniata]|uniref:RNI-like protein n=1 Tax=Patiria miniata TaxID=46514 RepID=A0A913ZS72_PATMI|nr:uncharacterized protein LOC119726353 [Patiria miniata]